MPIYTLNIERRTIPIKVVIIPKICCLVIGSLKIRKAKTTNKVGLAPAIGATTVTNPLLIPKVVT